MRISYFVGVESVWPSSQGIQKPLLSAFEEKKKDKKK